MFASAGPTPTTALNVETTFNGVFSVNNTHGGKDSVVSTLAGDNNAADIRCGSVDVTAYEHYAIVAEATPLYTSAVYASAGTAVFATLNVDCARHAAITHSGVLDAAMCLNAMYVAEMCLSATNVATTYLKV